LGFVELTFLVRRAIVWGCFGIGAFAVKMVSYLKILIFGFDGRLGEFTGGTNRCAHCRQHSSPFLPAFPNRFKRKLNISHIRINKSKSLKSIAAPVQPLEASKLGHFKPHSAIQRFCSSNVLTPVIFKFEGKWV
jgi:hypothetical protein